jgi:hypothetical protein
MYNDNNRDLPKSSKQGQVFNVWYSKFVTTENTLSYVQQPRPCSLESIKLKDDPVIYWKSSDPLIFSIPDDSSYQYLSTLLADDTPENTIALDHKGNQDPSHFNFTAANGGEFTFYTNSGKDVGL